MTVVLGRQILANFKYPIRQPEVDLYYRVYTSLGINNPIAIPPGETFEGGDLYIHNGIVYIGVGARTSIGAALHIFSELKDELYNFGYKFHVVIDEAAHNRSRKEQMDFI